MARFVADLTPLRASPEFRRIYAGQVVSFVGSQITVVAVPVQVYAMTKSSLAVGLVGAAELGPLLVGSLVGGTIADSRDRRKLMLVMQVLLALCTVGLAVNASLDRPRLWPLYVLAGLSALFSGIDRPARGATIPRLVSKEQLPAANALWQILLGVGTIVGPSIGGLLIANVSLASVFWIDSATYLVAYVAVRGLPPLPPEGGAAKAGLGSIAEGLRFLKGKRLLQGTFVVDINAMVFGLPRALFPAIAVDVYRAGPGAVGLLHAAIGAGSLLGASTSGWVSGVHRQGRAVLVCVAIWGAAMAGFGVVRWLPLGLLLLAIAGAADVISAVFRNTILQSRVPDAMRGRMSSVHIAVVTGGPRLGDVESGVAAALIGVPGAVVTGGLACVVGVVAVARVFPELLRQDSRHPEPALPGLPHPPGPEPSELPPDSRADGAPP